MVTTEEAAAKIEGAAAGSREITEPLNLEEQAISLVGTDIYEKLIKELYGEAVGDCPCTELPAFYHQRGFRCV